MTGNTQFHDALIQNIGRNARDFQLRNNDYDRWSRPLALMIRVLDQVRSFFHRRGLSVTIGSSKGAGDGGFQSVDVSGLERLYELLEDEESRELLVSLTAFR